MIRSVTIAAAALAAWTASCRSSSGAGDGADFVEAFRDRPGEVRSLRRSVPASDLPRLEAAWGAPIVAGASDGRRVWLAPRGPARAVWRADTEQLSLGPYTPIDHIVAPRGRPLGIESAREFVDATADELAAAYPLALRSRNDDAVVLSWPPDDISPRDAFEATLGLRDGRVYRLAYRLHHGGAAAERSRIAARVTARYGSPAGGLDGPGPHTMSSRPLATLEDRDGDWVIRVSAVP